MKREHKELVRLLLRTERMAVVQALLHTTFLQSVGDVAREAAVNPRRASEELVLLFHMGLVQRKPDGNQRLYRLDRHQRRALQKAADALK